MEDGKLINPYDYNEYNIKTLRVLNSKKKDKYKSSLANYKFAFGIQGDNIDKELLMTCSYIGGDNEECSFILEEEDIDKLIGKLQIVKSVIEIGKNIRNEIKKCHDILNGYINAGYIESITITRKDYLLPPYYQPSLFMAFVIQPIFKNTVKPSDSVNTMFNFLEVLHLDIDENKYAKTMEYIRNHHEEIPISIIGWDRDAIIEKRKKEALKDADKHLKDMKDGTKAKNDAKYRKMLCDMVGLNPVLSTDEAIFNAMNEVMGKK